MPTLGFVCLSFQPRARLAVLRSLGVFVCTRLMPNAVERLSTRLWAVCMSPPVKRCRVCPPLFCPRDWLSFTVSFFTFCAPAVIVLVWTSEGRKFLPERSRPAPSSGARAASGRFLGERHGNPGAPGGLAWCGCLHDPTVCLEAQLCDFLALGLGVRLGFPVPFSVVWAGASLTGLWCGIPWAGVHRVPGPWASPSLPTRRRGPAEPPRGGCDPH